MKIQAEIVADSLSPQGDRLTSLLITFPRIILAELNTHRVFSKNSASSRAIPFEKMVKMVETVPFIPIAWQKDHKGMQGNEYFTERISVDNTDIFDLKTVWLDLRDEAIKKATRLNRMGLTKQLCNRLLEPFMWHTVLLTGTEFKNFFELRCPKYEYYDMLTGNQQFFKSKKDWIQYYNNKPLPKAKHISKIPENDVEWLQINKSQAEIHMQALAEAMWDAMNESTPKKLQAGEWHIPFGDKLLLNIKNHSDGFISPDDLKFDTKELIKIATARCARLSYMTFDGEIDYEKDIQLHDRLLADGHMSPFEHCARAMADEEYYGGLCDVKFRGGDDFGHAIYDYGWCNNFKGFIPYRYMIENEKKKS